MTTTDHTAPIRPLRGHRLTRLASTDRLLVACDFDGTIAHLVDHPANARMTHEASDALTGLAQLAATNVAIVSGRPLSDLRQLLRMPGSVRLIGSHGAEDSASTPCTAPARNATLDAVADHLAKRIDDLRVEPKPFGVALHFRSAPVAHHELITSMIVDAFKKLPSVTIRRGHAIVEAAVVPTTKGDAITGLRAALGATSVLYCGDDSTDEDAFAALHPQDLGIKVGPGPTLATARVASPDALALVLGDLAIRRRRHRPLNSSKEDRT